ncbi:DNA gyrase inhibitor YacG [Devosia rhodophyticola]|uniref:DNA gyrase inhibitor YacG n=1 Tax=Devosia rhodophyticola TaxID=3026423 RepID=A0ABY7YZB1_9HYPH|nr:DNA gyrase inhibitor YacG [Devosia rhodophyticola]WDR06689.1 DNA gyrase inhibitor YacG [Devosia rhodophyticola]
MSEPERASKPCPICQKPSVEKFRPFCSARCADVDLNRWLTGAYVIPARDDEPTEDDADGELGYNEDDNI